MGEEGLGGKTVPRTTTRNLEGQAYLSCSGLTEEYCERRDCIGIRENPMGACMLRLRGRGVIRWTCRYSTLAATWRPHISPAQRATSTTISHRLPEEDCFRLWIVFYPKLAQKKSMKTHQFTMEFIFSKAVCVVCVAAVYPLVCAAGAFLGSYTTTGFHG